MAVGRLLLISGSIIIVLLLALKEGRSMSRLGGVALLVCALALAARPTWGEEVSQRAGRAGNFTVTYSADQSCRVIYRAPKPFLERAEDLLAYALDIPLAILSPFTCPIVAPILDGVDQGPERPYTRPRSKR